MASFKARAAAILVIGAMVALFALGITVLDSGSRQSTSHDGSPVAGDGRAITISKVAEKSGGLKPTGKFRWLRGVYSIEADGSHPALLLPGTWPYDLSADGSRIAYVPGRSAEIRIANMADGRFKTVKLEKRIARVWDLAWSPDDSRIVAFADPSSVPDPKRDSSHVVAVVHVDSGSVEFIEHPDIAFPSALPRWSPDSRQLALGARGGVFVWDLSGEVRKLAADRETYPHPQWSPDGKYVAYMSQLFQPVDSTGIKGITSGRLAVIPADGSSPPAYIFNFGQPRMELTWSPDSARIGFFFHETIGGLQTMIINRDGSGARIVGEGGTGSPAWSPDGRLAIARNGDLFLYDPATGFETRVTSLDIPLAEEPRWSPSGGLLFTYGTSYILRVEVLTKDVGGEQPKVLAIGGAPIWSPDGERIAFATAQIDSYRGSVYVIDADGGNLTKLAGTAVVPGDIYGACDRTPEDLAWSPDGERLAFAGAYGGRGGIVVAKTDGQDEPTVIPGSGSPSWSRDSLRLAYTEQTDEEKPDSCAIVIWDSRTGDRRKIGSGTQVSWSPREDLLAIGTSDNGVFITDTEGRVVKQVIAPTGIDHTPRARSDLIGWSADGSRIAYLRDSMILVATVDSVKAPVKVSTTGLESGIIDAGWAPDGKRFVFYSSDKSGKHGIYIAHAHGSGRPVLVAENGWHPALSPDGKRLAFARQ